MYIRYIIEKLLHFPYCKSILLLNIWPVNYFLGKNLFTLCFEGIVNQSHSGCFSLLMKFNVYRDMVKLATPSHVHTQLQFGCVSKSKYVGNLMFYQIRIMGKECLFTKWPIIPKMIHLNSLLSVLRTFT